MEGEEIDARLYEKTAKRVKEAWELVDSEKKLTIDKKKVSMIMRYLKSYPSEDDLKNLIYPHILDEDAAVIK